MILFISFFTLLHVPIFAKPIIFYDTQRVILPFIKSCSLNYLPQLRDPFRFYTLCVSDKIMGNMYIIPSISTIVLLLITFFITKHITHSKTYSLLAVLILVLTNSYSIYGFSATYDQTWVMLFFATIFLLQTKYRNLAVIPFMISLGFRGLPLLDLPIIISYILILDITKRQKLHVIIPFVLVGVASIVYILSGGYAITQSQQVIFDLKEGLSSLQTFRIDFLFYIFAIPVSYFLYRLNTKMSRFLLFSITYLVFQVYSLSAFTNLGQEPYRMFPLLIFQCMGVSYVLSNYFKRRIYAKI